MKLPIRLCVSAILAGKKPAPLPDLADPVGAVNTAPPPPKKEAIPTPRDGVVWSSGYWKMNNTWFVWCDGHWELSRPGQSYTAPHWEARADGWHFVPAAWHSDGTIESTAQSRRDVPYDMLGAFR